jgi:hypothetical protein
VGVLQRTRLVTQHAWQALKALAESWQCLSPDKERQQPCVAGAYVDVHMQLHMWRFVRLGYIAAWPSTSAPSSHAAPWF